MWQRLRNVFRRREVDADFFAELEGALLSADVGPDLTREWMHAVRKWKRADDVQRVLRERMLEILSSVVGRQALVKAITDDRRPKTDDAVPTTTPSVVLIVGVNGVGKTTTLAKLAHHFQREGKKPLLVAGDTFRAAAIEQLKVWADRIGCPVIAQQQGSDAAAVAFDGVTAGVARAVDVVLVDTAGRLHTKAPLMEELKKVQRVIGKTLPGAPHATWCILDATIGQNAIAQVKEFYAALTLTGLIVTKLDGTAKAGALFTIAATMSLPILYIGTGEQMTDLAPFQPEDFVAQIMG